MKKIAIINSDSKEFSYGGVSPIMRNMHDTLAEHFELEYYYLPDSWKRLPGPGRLKVMLWLRKHKKSIRKADFILSHIPEGSYVVSKFNKPYAHIYHGNTNPMVGSKYRLGKYFAGMFEKFFRRIEQTATLRYTVGPVWDDVKKLVNPISHNVKPLPIAERKGLIYAGRLENGKNIDRIIHLYSKLTPEERKAHPLTIAGTGTLGPMLKDLAKQLNLENEITFTGMLPNAALVALDSHQEVMLMASGHEGFPTAIAEAFTLGVPVVTTDVGDIPRFVKDGCNGRLLTREFRDEDYIAALRDVLANYPKYSANALETGKNFDARTITLQIVNDINAALEK